MEERSLLEDVASFFVSNELGVKDQSIHLSELPSTPDKALAIIDTGGLPSHRQVPLVEVTFNIQVRDVTYPQALATANKIYKLLNRTEMLELTTDGLILRWCYAFSRPIPIGADENRRTLFSLNFHASVYEEQLV